MKTTWNIDIHYLLCVAMHTTNPCHSQRLHFWNSHKSWLHVAWS